MAEQEGVDILAVDDRAARDGIGKWHDSGAVAPLQAGGLARRRRRCTAIWSAGWLAAKQGRSFKCLVLDLDNTLWGGVIGDDGLEGIALGQGSPLGEAYVAFQDYARELTPARRDPGGVLQERRGQRAGAVREASRHGAEARRHRQLRRQLVEQGGQYPRDRRRS